jgi:hypothetical protein
MKGSIRIRKVSVRLRGGTALEGQQRARTIAQEIGCAFARESTLRAPGKAAIGGLSVRVGNDGRKTDLSTQIRAQWQRK